MAPILDDSVTDLHIKTIWGPLIASAVLGSVATIGGAALYGRFLRRIPSSDAVRPAALANRRWISGIVTK